MDHRFALSQVWVPTDKHSTWGTQHVGYQIMGFDVLHDMREAIQVAQLDANGRVQLRRNLEMVAFAAAIDAGHFERGELNLVVARLFCDDNDSQSLD